jgi:hypothetical protein
VETFPTNLMYSGDGRYVCCFAEIPYVHDAHTLFKTTGKKVEDETLGLLWVPVNDIIGGKVKAPFKNSKVDLPAVPLAGLLEKLISCTIFRVFPVVFASLTHLTPLQSNCSKMLCAPRWSELFPRHCILRSAWIPQIALSKRAPFRKG